MTTMSRTCFLSFLLRFFGFPTPNLAVCLASWASASCSSGVWNQTSFR